MNHAGSQRKETGQPPHQPGRADVSLRSIHGAAGTVVSAHPLARGHSLFRVLDRPADVFAHLGPNWFASVMGTGIVATAAATPPMALLTVGAGALLLGPGLIGAHAAIAIDAVLWPLGTITGLAGSLAVPYLMSTRLQAAPDAAFGGWLMPVVPPMVSAATGALLVPHLPAGQLRLTMLLACYAMFGLSLIASLLVITQLWRRLVRYGAG